MQPAARFNNPQTTAHFSRNRTVIKTPLTYNPWTGESLPSEPERFAHHYDDANHRWLYNPWTGSRRPAAEVEADLQGLKLGPPSHDPGTTSPPTPATTEAGTGTQEPGATDREPASTSTPTPAPCAAPSAMNAVLSSLGAAVAEVNALTRTAVELATKCRALQERNGRLQERNDELVNRCRELNRLVDAAVKIRIPAGEAPAQPGPHMRAAAGEGGEK